MSPNLLTEEERLHLSKQESNPLYQYEEKQEITKQHYLWLIDTFKNDRDIYKMIKLECELLNKHILKKSETKALAKEIHAFILRLKYYK